MLLHEQYVADGVQPGTSGNHGSGEPMALEGDNHTSYCNEKAEVLDEVAKTVAALDDEMIRYLSLHFHSQQSITQDRAMLLEMEVG